MTDHTVDDGGVLGLTAPPRLAPLFVRGALSSPFKRPRADAPVPTGRLVLPGLRIDTDRLVRYERVCGFGAGTAELPVTYPHVLAFPLVMRLMSGRGFPLPLLGLVHTSIEIRQLRALSVNEVYELTVHVEKLAPHRRGTEAWVTVGMRAGGEVVWDSRSSYLARHGEGTASVGGSGAPVLLPELASWQLPADLGRRYARVSGDRNPIHLHPLTARLFGFPRAIAHGMWTLARCVAEHGVPGGAVRVRGTFKAPVALPASVVYAARGTAFQLRGTGVEGRIHLSGDVTPL